jgi:hypothetical protein
VWSRQPRRWISWSTFYSSHCFSHPSGWSSSARERLKLVVSDFHCRPLKSYLLLRGTKNNGPRSWCGCERRVISLGLLVRSQSPLAILHQSAIVLVKLLSRRCIRYRYFSRAAHGPIMSGQNDTSLLVLSRLALVALPYREEQAPLRLSNSRDKGLRTVAYLANI